jgi:hypothetical protein
LLRAFECRAAFGWGWPLGTHNYVLASCARAKQRCCCDSQPSKATVTVLAAAAA